MSYVSKIFTVTLLGLTLLLTGCDPSGLSGADQILKETKPGTIQNSSQLNVAATEYKIVDLGTLDGGFSAASGINENGQVVGVSRKPESEASAFLWDEIGGMQDLGKFGGVSSNAYGINDGGEIFGIRNTSSGDREALIWTEESGQRVIETKVNNIFVTTNSINNDGKVVFNEQLPTKFEAYFWDEENGELYLGTLGGNSSVAYGINDFGQVIGTAQASSLEFHAFIWDKKEGMKDLGTLGGTISTAKDINNVGQVVGNSETSSGERHAFLWDELTGMRDLGTLGGTRSNAHAINDVGQVVGQSQTESGDWHAFVWDEVNGMRDLGISFVGYSSANSINNLGQIVGFASETSNIAERRATLWNPVENNDATPPEITFETVNTTLWPPNHKMRLVLSDISANDNIDENPTLTVSVESNERLNGLGDGNTDEDWQIIQAADDSYDVYVRAERNGNGSGRTYTVTITAEDASGNVAEEQVEVQVVRDRGKILN